MNWTRFEIGVREKWRTVTRTTWSLLGAGLLMSGAAGTAVATAPQCDGVVVSPGDTLSAIARRTGAAMDELERVNGIVDRDLIYAGQCLELGDPMAAQRTGLSTRYSPAAADLGYEQPGARALADAMDTLYPGGGYDVDPQYGVGIYNGRRARGSDDWSVHAEGRAVDYYTPDCGAEWAAVFDFLVAKAGDLGLQRVLWCDRAWQSTRGGFEPSEALAHMHDGTTAPAHFHIELSWDGAENLSSARAFAVLADVASGSVGMAGGSGNAPTDMPTLELIR